MIKVISNIIKNKSRVVVLSPHFDDAIFSMGGLLNELKNKAEITVVNIFTKQSKPYTLSAKKFLSQCGYKDLETLYKHREIEDKKALTQVGAKIINLDFEDALFRKIEKPNLVQKLLGKKLAEFLHIYPTYKFNISKGMVSKNDRANIDKLISIIKDLKLTKNDYLFAPMGIGKHVDHKIANIVEQKMSAETNTIFYADYPYLVNSNINKNKFMTFKPDWKVKEKLLKKYRSQFRAIFKNEKADKIDEFYFIDDRNINKQKSYPFYIFIVLLSTILYALTIRGNWNVPTATQIDTKLFESGKAFETSQERSRYAMILSLVNDHTFSIDNYASMGTPDIGFIKGHYYSFFPPGASILAIPLYLLGLKLGATQIFTFLISTIFALLTILLIVKFSKKLDVSWPIAIFSAISFGFATNAWGYSITLYAHLISAFLILSGLYIAVIKKSHSTLDSILFWILYSSAVFIDFPNLFIFLPIALIFTFSGTNVVKIKDKSKFSFGWKYLLTPIVFLGLMGVYGYYNYVHFGRPTILSNSIPRVRDLKTTIQESTPEDGRESVGALNTRSMLKGFQSFTTNTDRGVFIYSPIIVLAIFILFGAYKNLDWKEKTGLIGVPATCLILYTMFGDPYGGWAFGSRYMIAIMPELCILMGYSLNYLHKNIFVKIIFTLVFLYSLGISLMAPLTTNVIPPKIEATGLGLNYDYRINIRMLSNNELNSFVYNNYANKYVTGWQYYSIIYSIVAITGVTLIWIKTKKYEEN